MNWKSSLSKATTERVLVQKQPASPTTFSALCTSLFQAVHVLFLPSPAVVFCPINTIHDQVHYAL